MADLELVGLHADGEHLVLIGPEGHRHRVAIDDALRAAIRNDRPRLEQVRTASLVRPREIQSRIRAGESPVDIAKDAGVPVEQVRRYEGPVTAERNWVAEQARLIALGRESDAPRLGELVVDRLARRGVDPSDLSWTAVRRPGEGWELVLEFRVGERDSEARWGVDIPTRALHALDDESRWLSETDLATPDARRHLSSVQSRVYDIEVDGDAPAPPADPAPHWASSRPRRNERRADAHKPGRGDRGPEHVGAEKAGAEPVGTENVGTDKAGAENVGTERARPDGAVPGVAAGQDAARGRAEGSDIELGDTVGDGSELPGAEDQGAAQIADQISRVTASSPAERGSDLRARTQAADAHPDASAPGTESAIGSTAEGADANDPRDEADRRTAELLEGLRASRGVRQEIGRLEEEDDDEAEWGVVPAAHAAAAPAKERPPATVRQLRPMPASAPEAPEATADHGSEGLAGPESPAGSAGSARSAGSAGSARSARSAGAKDSSGSTGTEGSGAAVPGAVADERPADQPTVATGERDRTRAQAPAARSATPSRPMASQKPEPRPQAGPARPRTQVADRAGADDQETAILAPVLPPGDPARKSKSKSRRTSVPSWDEIVFGAKPE